MYCFRPTAFFTLTVVIFIAVQIWLRQPRHREYKIHTTLRPQNPELEVPQHPLDPLTFSEIQQLQYLLWNTSFAANPKRLKNGKKPNVFIHGAALHEPDKADLLVWNDGDPLPSRKAFVIMRVNDLIYKIVVDLSVGTIVKEELHRGTGKPPLSFHDLKMAASLPLKYSEFLDSLKSRDLDKKEVTCLAFPAGWFDAGDEDAKRIAKVQCYYHGGTKNYYLRPIEGITMVVNLDTEKIVKYIEHESVPLPKAEGTDYHVSAQKAPFLKPLNRISLEQPFGPSFTVEGHKVNWGNWEFHVKPDYRAGVIISQAAVRDPITGIMRSVLFKGFASELFIPYMDPTEGWYFRTHMAVGEYGFGLQCLSLQPLNDCPQNAYYMDGVFVDPDGNPYVRSNMLCIFESYGGDIAWRHSEGSLSDKEYREVRPKVKLVVRVIASVVNHDYILDWEFQQDGLIRVKVGASGILMVKSTEHETVSEAAEATEEFYGTLVAEKTVGVLHDHFMTFYLDLDVDGTQNTFVQNRMVRKKVIDSKSPRKSYWGIEKTVAKTEDDAKVKISLFKPADYTVMNPKKKTKVGNQVSYKIVPGKTAGSLLALDDPPQIRSAFTINQMWVTPYNRSEEYASGLFTYQSQGEDTLLRWTRRDRPIENRDIVVWYTVGFHHIPSQEEFPVMPTVTQSFELKPTNFFESNPIVKTRPNYEKDLPQCAFST